MVFAHFLDIAECGTNLEQAKMLLSLWHGQANFKSRTQIMIYNC